MEARNFKTNKGRRYSVELMGDLPRIELFAREKTKGWDTWGNETPDNIQKNKQLNT